MVKNNNDELNYDEFHSAFTCMQGDSPERKAHCLLAGRANNEKDKATENAVHICEGDKACASTALNLDIETTDPDNGIANLNIGIMKQADFGRVIRQVQEMQATVLTMHSMSCSHGITT